jgi:hypothetical protein
MNAHMAIDFCWDDLVRYIHEGDVIPVIGDGLYWVHPKADPDAEPFLLYPFLADTFVTHMGLEPGPPGETFFQAVFRYQERHPEIKNLHNRVKDFLCPQWATLELVPDYSLKQLARINKLGIFINTTYDNYLQHTLKQIRNHEVKTLHYTLNKKWSISPDITLIDDVKAGKCSLIFNIYGNAVGSGAPAFTEKDILETIVTFQKDMETQRNNIFFQTVERSNLLFIGCGYDDWLFRFFIRSLSRSPYQKGGAAQHFLGDDFDAFHCGDLQRFLKAHGTEVYYSKNNLELVAQLFRKVEAKHPADIVAVKDYPAPVFISFIGADRPVAQRLVAQLQEDGIQVWLDEGQLPAGQRVDDKIASAISACPIFIPLVSQNASQLQHETGTAITYHIREWEWAYGAHIKHHNPKHIIPVKIDDTPWMWDTFKPLVYMNIPGGNRTGDYEKLRHRLQALLKQ